MTPPPIPGQVYSFRNSDNETAELVVWSVTDEAVEYKFIAWNGEPGHYTYTITRKGWDLRPNGMRLVGMMKLEEQ